MKISPQEGHKSSRFDIYLMKQRKIKKKDYFLCLKTSFLAQNYTILFISLVFKWNKKFICLIVRDVSFQKQLQQPPWWIDFAKILPKCVQ